MNHMRLGSAGKDAQTGTGGTAGSLQPFLSAQLPDNSLIQKGQGQHSHVGTD